ncbi:cytochrome P450 hydroxylase [Streptomyces filipinensis]|uniref:Cytochrome P450 hydroxylase n=1 Tax=Streptomyces filipinensis TaxID=66887 RepID=A0A918IFL1_9ACTN|nr:cytochrome P450 [Streptomyces filipinensis]GGV09041.1 cytochrome P450 hydroxylase [Streptomyces filipinensis]
MTSAPASLFNDALMTDPYGTYARLREAGPVHRTITPDGAPVWVVTRYEDVRAALTDPRLSLNKANVHITGRYQSSMPPELDAHLLNLDPPDHTRLRRLVSKAFTARRIEGLRQRVQAHADELLAAITERPADLMPSLANPLPMEVICELLGIPAADRRDFHAWTDSVRGSSEDAAVESRAAMREMHRYLTGVIAAKRNKPTDDLLTAMTEAHDEHDSLSEPELLAMSFLLLFTGYTSAVNLIGNATLALLLHPAVMDSVRAGHTPVRAVVEETLRWNAPVTLGVRRFTLEDVTIGGITIPTGSRVWVSLASANRDPAQFTDADCFQPERPSTHLDFGHGIHYCLGAPLARLEAEVALTGLIARFPDLRLAVPAEELEWLPSFHHRGLKALPVTW